MDNKDRKRSLQTGHRYLINAQLERHSLLRPLLATPTNHILYPFTTTQHSNHPIPYVYYFHSPHQSYFQKSPPTILHFQNAINVPFDHHVQSFECRSSSCCTINQFSQDDTNRHYVLLTLDNDSADVKQGGVADNQWRSCLLPATSPS